VRVVGLAVAVLLLATARSGGEVRRIRLCADPSNLPFSSQDAKRPGFEVEIARAIAEALGAEFSVHWFPTAREFLALRQLYDGRCDLFMGLPLTGRFTDDKPRLIFSAPYYVMRQVVVSPGTGAVRSLAEHPLPDLVAAGVRCSIATDDPQMFDTDLTRDYEAATSLGISPRLFYEAGVAGALCGPETKERLSAIGDGYDWSAAVGVL